MNDIIKDLFEQACFETEYDDVQNLKEMSQKFAELIVRECCGAADEWYQKHNELHWDPAQHIRNHFGVEE